MSFKIAIVGRPNVGKSTLFNRLAGKKLAIVHDSPGVTRDWKETKAELFGYRFTIVDTAGLESKKGDTLAQRMSEKSKQAAAKADLIFFVVDARAGVHAEDKSIGRELRKTGKPILLLANKCEGTMRQNNLAEWYALGFETVIPVSAMEGEGFGEVADYLKDYIKSETEVAEAEEAKKPLKLAIVGKPNAGKSTLINQLIGEDRLLTGPEAGITRDAIAVRWRWKHHDIELVDTAGLRRKAKVVEKLESLATADTIQALNMAEIVLVVLDISQGITQQDLIIAQMAEREGRAVVVVINKWDLIKEKAESKKAIGQIVAQSLPQMKDVPVVYVSALKGNDLDKIMKESLHVHKLWNRRIPTNAFNKWLRAAVDAFQPPIVKGKRLKLRYGTQIKTRPPTFVLFVNSKYDMPDSYQRYLVNKLRDYFDMPGVPIRFFLRQGENPYKDD